MIKNLTLSTKFHKIPLFSTKFHFFPLISTEECCKLYNKREAKSGAIRLFASSYYPQRRGPGFFGAVDALGHGVAMICIGLP